MKEPEVQRVSRCLGTKITSSNYECSERRVCLAGIDLLPACQSPICSFQQLRSLRTGCSRLLLDGPGRWWCLSNEISIQWQSWQSSQVHHVLEKTNQTQWLVKIDLLKAVLRSMFQSPLPGVWKSKLWRLGGAYVGWASYNRHNTTDQTNLSLWNWPLNSIPSSWVWCSWYGCVHVMTWLTPLVIL